VVTMLNPTGLQKSHRVRVAKYKMLWAHQGMPGALARLGRRCVHLTFAYKLVTKRRAFVTNPSYSRVV